MRPDHISVTTMCYDPYGVGSGSGESDLSIKDRLSSSQSVRIEEVLPIEDRKSSNALDFTICDEIMKIWRTLSFTEDPGTSSSMEASSTALEVMEVQEAYMSRGVNASLPPSCIYGVPYTR